MGHDVHFLERLERLDNKHLEGAFALYRDAEFVQMILKEAKIPDGAERVALSLDDPIAGPFVVVARNGHFVTCLGEGMEARGLPVVKRGQLDAMLARMTVYRDRMAVWDQRVARYGSVSRLWRRVFHAGHMLNREDFVGAASTSSIFQADLWKLIVRSADSCRQSLTFLLRPDVSRTFHKPSAVIVDLMRDLWIDTWRAANCLVLATVDGQMHPDVVEVFTHKDWTDGLVGTTGFQFGLMAQMVRGAWAAGRMGKVMLRSLKDRFASAGELWNHAGSTMSLLATAIRYPKMAAEIQKVLNRTNPFLERTKRLSGGSEVAPDLASVLAPIQVETVRLGINKLLPLYKTRLWKTYPSIQTRFADAAEIPSDVAIAEFANSYHNVYLRPEKWNVVLPMCVGLVAGKPAEAMYLEEEWVKELVAPWEPHMTVNYLVGPLDYIEYHHRTRTIAKSDKVPRNDPCTCGSGKKYKKCHGANG